MIWIQFFITLCAVGVVSYLLWILCLKNFYHHLCLVKRGVQTTAEITYFLDSLIKVQYRPMFYIKLHFYINEHEVITDRIKMLIKKNEVAQYVVGKKVTIKYDPKNMNNVAILSVIDEP